MNKRTGAFASTLRAVLWRAANLVAILVTILITTGGAGLHAQDIHLKTRTFQTSPANPADVGADQTLSAIHKIIQYDHPPGGADLGGLAAAGIVVVAALPDNAVVVAAPGGFVQVRSGMIWIGSVQPADKLSPRLDGGAGVAAGEAEVNSTALVEFHADLSPAEQDTVASAEGLVLQRPAVLRPNHALATGSLASLRALAGYDEVAYIFPADPGLLTDSDLIACAGMLTVAGPVGQYANIVHGWDLDADHVARLGYVFGSITPKVPAATVESEVIRALQEWSKAANIVFEPVVGLAAPRSVAVKFVSGAHGDSYPFDGPGGIVGHTFYPVPINAESIAGDIHLDADENWHAGGDVDIFSVALHEAGHAIGLGHSDQPGDVMYPYYRSRMALSANDRGAAQALYGPAAGASVTGAPPGPAAPPMPGPASPPMPGPASPPAGTGGAHAAVLPLKLVVDTVPPSAQTASIAITGTLAGGRAPYSVQWQTDHGYSGQSAMRAGGGGSIAWTTAPVALAGGSNTVTVTAFDSARQTTTQALGIAYQAPSAPPAGGNLPVSISILSPAGVVTTVNTAVLNISGTATGASGISRITWQTAGGAAGTALGTDRWTVQGIPLFVGTNTVIVRAWDSKGSNAWASLVAIRR